MGHSDCVMYSFFAKSFPHSAQSSAQIKKATIAMSRVPISIEIISILIVVVTSDENNFTCLNGQSIGANRICDGRDDCLDASDERSELCATIICAENNFKCYYGACVGRDKLCNGAKDCLDGSDEANCGKLKGSCG